MKIIIAGGGVIGLCAAYYLNKSGYEITVIDKNVITTGASFGNAGYISPSHFIPLASPGIVAQGLRWMLNSSSPFYIKPRLNTDLVKFCYTFFKNANENNVRRNAPHLCNLLNLSRQETINIKHELGNTFKMEEKGCLMLFKTIDAEKHEIELIKVANNFNVEARMLNAGEVQAMEPDVKVNIRGAAYYPMDCHLHPGDFMHALKLYLENAGVKFLLNTTIINVEKNTGKVTSVITDKEKIVCDELVIAAGSWSASIAAKLGIRIILQAGKGYSITYNNIKCNLRYPAILVERRVALTPMGKDLRMGGTMEISGLKSLPILKRAKAIYNAAKEYYPDLEVSFPEPKMIWSGLRPLSPDGLPYIGRPKNFKNVLIATGHAMLGLSLAAATGKLCNEIIDHKQTSVDIEAFCIERFN
jgi:D-amino-acid dehydrogenase